MHKSDDFLKSDVVHKLQFLKGFTIQCYIMHSCAKPKNNNSCNFKKWDLFSRALHPAEALFDTHKHRLHDKFTAGKGQSTKSILLSLLSLHLPTSLFFTQTPKSELPWETKNVRRHFYWSCTCI